MGVKELQSYNDNLMRSHRCDMGQLFLPGKKMLSILVYRSIMYVNLIHEFPTVRSSTKTRDFRFFTLVSIKQVIVPVHQQRKKL